MREEQMQEAPVKVLLVGVDIGEEADFEQLTIQQIFENGEETQSVPVIPGTSWAGAIRSRTKKLLKDLNCSEEAAERMINGWFGYVDVCGER